MEIKQDAYWGLKAKEFFKIKKMIQKKKDELSTKIKNHKQVFEEDRPEPVMIQDSGFITPKWFEGISK